MSGKLNAFVPAAGVGERLRPITANTPKPLLPVLGKSLLARTLERVSVLPVERIGLNLHYRAGDIASWVESSGYRDLCMPFHEAVLLGTGGALKNAEALLGGGVFLVHNSDILTDIDLPALVEAHERSGNIATLALHDYPAFNKVAVDENGRVCGVAEVSLRPGAERILAFTGVAVYDAAFLSHLPSGESNVVDAWLDAIAAGCAVGSVDVTGSLWHDIGTPAGYTAAVVDALRRDGEWVYVGSCVGGRGVELDGYVAIEDGCTLGDGASLRNAIVHPGARIEAGERYENCIVGPDYCVTLSETQFLGFLPDEHGVPIGVGGSGRRYYRAQDNGRTVVRMVCQPDEPDYERHLAYSKFFARHGVPVPELLDEDPESKQAVFEDLGDLSLYNHLRFPREPEEVERLYGEVLARLVTLHVEASRHVADCPLLAERIFDYDYFRWETAYFMERFVEGLRGLRPESRDAIEDELDRLAREADALPKAIIHRDLQSQNIMVARGETRFIDYQGARLAPPAYDIASLLWDPYFRLDDAMRARLLAYYVRLREERAPGEFEGPSFNRALKICRLQRHMQALGAYGFLSTVRGKPYFLKHVPEGLRLLKSDIDEAGESYPALAALVAQL